MRLFQPYKIKNMTIRNRIVRPPMCMYQADTEGMAQDFHFTHYTTRAYGGVGLIILEASGVRSEGRISDRDLGIWHDRHIAGLKHISDACRAIGAKTAIQINHAGRKSGVKGGELLAPSGIPFNEDSRRPRALTNGEIEEIISAFKSAARRAEEAGFDALEIHGAHGYLISEFLSPLTNQRVNEYGQDRIPKGGSRRRP